MSDAKLDEAEVERVARAIWNSYADAPLNAEVMPDEPTDWREYNDLSDATKEVPRRYARAAIAALARPAPVVPSGADSVMHELYVNEINARISSMWDSGWLWELGDVENGFTSSGQAEDWDSAVYELAEAAANSRGVHGFWLWWVEGGARNRYWPKEPTT